MNTKLCSWSWGLGPSFPKPLLAALWHKTQVLPLVLAFLGLSLIPGVSVSAGKTNQTITGSVTPTTIFVGEKAQATATASSNLTPVTFSTSTPTVCSVDSSSGVVTGIAPTTCTISAYQAGNGSYNSKTQNLNNITVAKRSQTITGSVSTYQLFVGETLQITATASSGGTVTFSSSDTSRCSVDANGLITAISASGSSGRCRISITQAGNNVYNAATLDLSTITVAQRSQTITGVFDPTQIQLNGTATLEASADSGLPVTLSNQTTSKCTLNTSVSPPTVTAKALGTCTIRITQTGNTEYSAATYKDISIPVVKFAQTIDTFTYSPTTVVVKDKTTVGATATSGLKVTFTALTSSICSVGASTGTAPSIATVTAIKTGKCTIAADQGGDSTYASAFQRTIDITIDKADQALSGVFNPNTLVAGGGTSVLTVPSSNTSVNPSILTGLTVTLESQTTSICTINPNTSPTTVTGIAGGTCIISASQDGTNDYNAATSVDITATGTNQQYSAGSPQWCGKTKCHHQVLGDRQLDQRVFVQWQLDLNLNCRW